MLALPNNHILLNKYQIISQIAVGGFGITYKAVDLDNGKAICIKELFVFGKCTRNNDLTISALESKEFSFKKMTQDFLKEGERLNQFSNPNIVSIIDVFHQNNTAYLVLDFIEGLTLKEHIETKGLMSADKAFYIMSDIFNAVEDIHSKKMLHRDIKPENIIINKNNQAILLDFGAARDFTPDKTVAQTTMVTPGYAPLEQYNQDARKGEFTDVYGLGATLYFLLTGIRPLNATDRIYNELKAPHQINPSVSTQVSSAIMLAMQMKPEDRFQSIIDFKLAVHVLTRTGELTVQKDSSEPKETSFTEKVNELVTPKDSSEPKETITDKTISELVTPKDNSEPIEHSFTEKVSPSKKKFFTKSKVILLSFILLILAASYPAWSYYIEQNTLSEIKKNMVEIKAGSFLQGCDNCEQDEKPTHSVTISGFKISKYQVTQKQWYLIMNNRPSYHANCDECPVENVSWNDIQGFIKKLNSKSNSVYRLPSEAEWEFVSRNGENPNGTNYDYKYIKGSTTINDIAWYKSNSNDKTHPVGQKYSNDLGIYDLVGNVREWCNDWYEENYYSSNSSIDPQGPASSTINCRVLKGGSFASIANKCRITNRSYLNPSKKNKFNGFRLAKKLD